MYHYIPNSATVAAMIGLFCFLSLVGTYQKIKQANKGKKGSHLSTEAARAAACL